MHEHDDDCGCPPGTHEAITAENEFLEGERAYGAECERKAICAWLRSKSAPSPEIPDGGIEGRLAREIERGDHLKWMIGR